MKKAQTLIEEHTKKALEQKIVENMRENSKIRRRRNERLQKAESYNPIDYLDSTKNKSEIPQILKETEQPSGFGSQVVKSSIVNFLQNQAPGADNEMNIIDFDESNV